VGSERKLKQINARRGSPPTADTADLKSAESKAVPREGRQEERSVKDMQMQETISGVPETAKQEIETFAPWAWVEASVWTERMLAALDNGVKGGKWFSLMDKVYASTTLQAAWKQVAKNKGSAGIDWMGIEGFARQEERYLKELQEQLKSGNYQPQAVKRVHIPKAGGGQRPLGIPTVKDRVVQAALKKVIEPIFEKEFAERSYGFRPGKGCKDALREVDAKIKEGYIWVVDADLKAYFDTIPKDKLMEGVKSKISDGRVLELMERYLNQNIIEELREWKPTMGVPQGAVISPLMANLYLHPLDIEMEQEGYCMVRYADDSVILCRTETQAQEALKRMQTWVKANGLTLHPDKTHVGNCMVAGQGFDFLGYRFEGGKRGIRKKSLQALKDKIRSRTGRSRGDSIPRCQTSCRL
jgi:RNA-directed DNA polymerase